MKFKKFSKALLMSALSVGVVLSVTSCVQSFTVGFLYVTNTVTASSTGNGQITGFKIDHNTGKLNQINGMPVSSGGANPVRAVLLSGGRFLYVLNRGANVEGNTNCTPDDPCQNANITQFVVGSNGILTPQETFYTQGKNPFRIVADSSGTFIYVLDHDSPVSPADPNCTKAFGNGACGDISAFQVNPTTGRLSLLVNAQVTSATGSALPYFPVPVNPIDFLWNSSFVLTLSGAPGATAQTGDFVFPYTYSSSGQLTVNQNTPQPINAAQATAIVAGAGNIYVLDNEPVTITTNGTSVVSPGGQILSYTVGTNGALQAKVGGAIPDDPSQSNPIYLTVESKGKWAYVANQGNNTNNTNAQSGIAGYVIDPATQQLSLISGGPFGTGAGPQCLIEDPSDQFIYTANFNDSTVTGRVIDQNSGVLNNLNAASSYTLSGPATWCLVNGRTS